MLNDTLSNSMSAILNSELVGKPECMIKPISKVIKEVLKVMKENNYVGDFKEIEDSKGNHIIITLKGGINKCGVIKPRHSIKMDDFEKFERRYLPAKDVGMLIVSTQNGIMTHYEAKSKKTGGRLLAYCY